MPDVPPSDPPSLIDQFLETSYDVFNDVSDTLYGDVFETPDYIVPPQWEGDDPADWTPDWVGDDPGSW